MSGLTAGDSSADLAGYRALQLPAEFAVTGRASTRFLSRGACGPWLSPPALPQELDQHFHAARDAIAVHANGVQRHRLALPGGQHAH
jgi:hypothetical protein